MDVLASPARFPQYPATSSTMQRSFSNSEEHDDWSQHRTLKTISGARFYLQKAWYNTSFLSFIMFFSLALYAGYPAYYASYPRLPYCLHFPYIMPFLEFTLSLVPRLLHGIAFGRVSLYCPLPLSFDDISVSCSFGSIVPSLTLLS